MNSLWLAKCETKSCTQANAETNVVWAMLSVSSFLEFFESVDVSRNSSSTSPYRREKMQRLWHLTSRQQAGLTSLVSICFYHGLKFESVLTLCGFGLVVNCFGGWHKFAFAQNQLD